MKNAFKIILGLPALLLVSCTATVGTGSVINLPTLSTASSTATPSPSSTPNTSSTATPTPSSTPVHTPTPTPTPVPTATPAHTPTPTPTATPVPTATPTSTPGSSAPSTWTVLSFPTEADLGSANNVFVSKTGYIFLSTATGMFRGVASQCENQPSACVWTQLTNIPVNSLNSAKFMSTVAYIEMANGDVAVGFHSGGQFSPGGTTYAVLPNGATSFVISSGVQPVGYPIGFAMDSAGYIYGSTLFQQQFQRSTDGGYTWSNITGMYGYSADAKLGLTAGGFYALSIINDVMRIGGEGPNLVCNLTMTTCNIESGSTSNYSRNGEYFLSDGGPGVAATEILAFGKYDSVNTTDIMRYDTTSNSWNQLTLASGLTAYADMTGLVGTGAAKGALTHEYFAVSTTSTLHYVYTSTNGGVDWSIMDTSAIPTSGSAQITYVSIDPINDVKFLMVNGPSHFIYLKR